jgi:hypothetical protein
MKIVVMTTIIIVTIVIIVLTIIIINYDACWNKYQITIYIYILPYRWEPNYIPIIYMTILVWYFIGILVVLE